MKKEAKDSQLRLWKTKKDRNVLLINDVIGSEGMNLQVGSKTRLPSPTIPPHAHVIPIDWSATRNTHVSAPLPAV